MKEKIKTLDKNNEKLKLKKLVKKQKLQERGITLIALVVTIIILLILAGVTLNIALSDNGLFKKAKQVAQKSSEAMIKEEVALLFNEWESEYYESGTEVKGRSGDTMSGAYVEYDGETILYEKDGITYQMSISENGDIGEISEIEVEKDSQSYKARHPEEHIPVGFQHTIGTVSEGYVIEDKEGNEFVWIPVDGKRIKYEKKLGTVNQCLKTSNQIEKLSSIEESIAGDMLGTFENNGDLASKLTSEIVSSELIEKTIIENAGGFWVGRYEAGINTESAREMSVINNNDETLTETGNVYSDYWESNKDKIVVQKGMEPVRMIPQKEALKIANSWGYSNEEEKTGVSYQSGLITGCEWDVMCEFIGWNFCDSLNQSWGNCWNVLGEENYNGFHSSSPGSNWILDNNFQKPACVGMSGTNRTEHGKLPLNGCYSVFPTGSFINSSGITTEKKHIFDVLGNVSEYTTESPAENESHHIFRISCAIRDSGLFSASSRTGGDTGYNCHATAGFRIVLYVK